MPVTVIKFMRNATGARWSVLNLENPDETSEGSKASHTLYPGGSWSCDIRIPQVDAGYEVKLGQGSGHIMIITPRRDGIGPHHQLGNCRYSPGRVV